VVVRTLVTTVCLTPLMTYLVLPQVTRALQWWLHGKPPPWRHRARNPR
jgi:antibiotic biosynthesis monooxygenase (ABM) superfamily enzyme